MKKLLLCALVTALFVGCAKIHEDVSEERIPQPRHDVEIPTNNPWDPKPQSGTPTGK